MIADLLCGLIRLYQRTLSPDHGILARLRSEPFCSHRPTCSDYTRVALRRHGVLRGSRLAASRLIGCGRTRPANDPVPRTKARWLPLLLVVVLAGCGSDESNPPAETSVTSATPAVAATTPEPAQEEATEEPTQEADLPKRYAVLYKAAPITGGPCGYKDGVAYIRAEKAREAGLPVTITKSEEYTDFQGGFFCGEYGRFATVEEAEAAIKKINQKLDDPDQTESDGNAAEIHEVVE